jgi:ubiquinone biosynthesis protein
MMKRLKQLFRLLHINHILAKNGLDEVVVSLRIFAPFRFIVYLNPWNWFRKTKRSKGEALRLTLEALGPIFIKFGQALSTRPDVFPEDIITELAKLQDNVPPFKSEEALAIIETAFGQSAFDVFAEFDEKPLASASIAQVHTATLKSGEAVVVKILRPNIKKSIQRDISLLKSLASLAHKYWRASRRLKPKEVVREFEQGLLDELDLHREAANASQLKRNFANSPLLYVPQIHWDYVHHNILVMERIHGIPVTDMKALRAQGICLKTLAERGVEIFFTQVFRDCFFHADMHPGNIFVSPQFLKKPQYICVDFGIMGTLNNNDKRYLAENLLAFFNRDYRRVAELHIESGWINRDTRVDAFESAIRTVCEPIFEKPLKDISFALLILRLFEVARRFHMEVQPELILLQKTLMAIEGLGRQLYPDLDLWATAKPFLEDWIREQVSPRALFKHLKDNLPFLIEELPHMPKLLSDLLVLNKKQHIRALEMQKMPHEPASGLHNKLKPALCGSFVTFLILAGLHYTHLLGG